MARLAMGQFLHVSSLLMRSRDIVGMIRTAVDLYAKGLYIMLGDSYVHGIMDGEVFGLQDGIKRGLDKIVLV